CSNCGITHSANWRRGQDGKRTCNACGLYFQRVSRPETPHLQLLNFLQNGKALLRCENCDTSITTVWRRDARRRTVCNACGLYYRIHGCDRPIELRTDIIRPRYRIDSHP
ncbi:hypothetical protein PUNSTDRAFT_20481, partial [Punctularia strigosozonata HHB-11173 SS5]|uniref:uncharacterized protein n=1 Tax=Punctularia strigosozonata (strain HHB-11173) TaxID=741275 RepID=UPI0004417B9D